MRSRWFPYASSILLLLVFLGSKSMESHGLLHADEENGPACEWCEYALLLEATPFHPPLSPVLETAIVSPLPGQHPEATLPAFRPQYLKGTLFCRPPPAGTRELL